MTILCLDTTDVELNISDHKATLTFFEFIHLPVSCSKRKAWYYDRANSDELNRLTDTENWDFNDSTDIDDV